MGMRVGYKKTEVGLIPDDWLVGELGQLIKKISSGKSSTDSQIGEFPIYGSTGIIGWKNYFDYSGEKILVARVGANAGTVNRVAGNYCVSDNTLMISYGNGFDISFSYFQLISFKLNKLVFGSGQPLITGGQLKQLVLAYPPTLVEQTAIANALSDADALIGSLQKLIAKKRQIKQGAMQTLLNPYENGVLKTGWMVQKLGEMCEKITTGKLDANAMVAHGDYPFFTCAKEHYWIDKYAFDTEALLVSGNGANVGYIHYYNGKFNAYQRTYVLSGFSNHIHFLKLYMARNLQERIRIEVNAGNTPYIVMGTLTEMDVFLPIDIAEQIHIAKILSDMDSEIAALETKLAKYQQIKQGMIQNLLTGRIRLV